ncbi:hypothetical protein [Azospirillum rugosum]|uniref:Uncharacterized protein n=1 Tax=Azospirillum rugosum TaxID=416170 RepID=A0ABS4SU07_9PROT|nr:hypothetical protein [Azospirillum rugosum]MBP2296046.1 hypothetical protein [Azospirillum rugosum]MDQ0529636.1 hypothetical protein [Azospirillum rugosum]
MTTESPEDLVKKLSAWRLYLEAISRQRKDRMAALLDAADAASARARRIRDEAEQARRRLDALSQGRKPQTPPPGHAVTNRGKPDPDGAP